MSQDTTTGASTPRRRRRWPWVLAAGLLFVVLLIGSLPWWLNTPAGNRMVADHVSRAFAPGRVRFTTIRFSWTGPTRLKDVVLEDPAGKPVVTSPAASLSAGLWGMIVRPERPGVLSLEQAAFDVERHDDGSIDLFRALEGIFAGRDPLRDLTIRATGATLRLRTPALAEPLASVAMDLDVQLRPAPERDLWTLDLRRAAGSELHARAEVDRWQESHELGVEISLTHWPLATRRGSLDLTTSLDGTVSARRSAGRWSSQGHMQAGGLRLAGEVLKGDAIDLADLAADWSVARGESGGWSVERFDATSPLGRVSAVVPDQTGSDPAPVKIEGRIDLAALSPRLPASIRPEGLDKVQSGTARLVVMSGQGPERTDWSLDASVADLVWKGGDAARPAEFSPPSLTGRGRYRPESGRVDVSALTLASRYGSLRASGGLGDLDGPITIDLAGTIEPDWAALTKVMRDRVEPRANLAGEPAPFRLKGPIRGAGDSLEVEAGLKLSQVDVFGMRLGPTPISVRSRGKRMAIAPIDATLNGGRLHVEPVLDLEAAGGPVLHLGAQSSLRDAAINQEVSRRVLSYVAPVLDQTTRASGRVSVAIEEASLPIGGDPGRRANVKGQVLFQDVEFTPGPLTREVVALVAPRREPGPLRLDQPVFLAIADGRVTQRGLAIPIGEVTRVEMEGWVDFDRNLGLVATLPVTPAMFGDNPLLGSIVAGTAIRIPIGGTLDAPKLDKAAFNADLKELGKTLLVRGAGAGALELLDRLSRPRDPNAPPPPTAEERKAQRLERRNERRRARGLDPLPGPDDRP